MLAVGKGRADTCTLCLTELPTDFSARPGWGEPGVRALAVGLQRIWLHECLQCGPSPLCQCSWSGWVPAPVRKWCSTDQHGAEKVYCTLLAFPFSFCPYESLIPFDVASAGEGERTPTITQLKFKVTFKDHLKHFVHVKEWILLLKSSYNQRSSSQQPLTLKQFWNLLLTKYRAIGLMQEFREAMLIPM